MDNPGTAWAVILNDPDLRQGMIREAERSRRSAQVRSRSLKSWARLAAALLLESIAVLGVKSGGGRRFWHKLPKLPDCETRAIAAHDPGR